MSKSCLYKVHQRLIENMNLPENWKEEIDEDPEILYRQAVTTNEVLLKLAKKMHSPGVSSSLSNGISITRVVSSSVYLATSHGLTDSSLWYDMVAESNKKILRTSESCSPLLLTLKK